MFAYSKSVEYFLRLVVFTCAALSLSACANYFGPFYVPSGYAQHNTQYKAPAGTEAASVIAREENKREKEAEKYRRPHYEPRYESRPSYSMEAEYDQKSAYDDGLLPAPVLAIEKQQPAQRHMMPMSEKTSAGHKTNEAARDLVNHLARGFGIPSVPVYLEMQGVPSSDLKEALQNTLVSRGYDVSMMPAENGFILVTDVSNNDSVSGDTLIYMSLVKGASVLFEHNGTYFLHKMKSVKPSVMPRTSHIGTSYRLEERQDTVSAYGDAIPTPSLSYPVDDEANSEPYSLFSE